MNPINNNFSTSRYNSYASRKAYTHRKQNEISENDIFGKNKTDKTGTNDTNKVTELSKKAQSVLDALTAKYGSNTSFIVRDFSSDAEAKSILSDSTSEFSVLLTPDELEKMANDKSYMKEKLDGIDGAMRMAEQINAQFGYTSTDKDGLTKNDISKIGVSFDNNGKMTLFADLEKATKASSDRTAAKKTSDRKNSANSKYTVKKKATVTASTTEELLKKLKGFSWKDVTETVEAKDDNGSAWDFNV
ncbi:MAG: hypothetical protein HDT47_07815 [Ruminococcaceae bacterium]|nr:hypothetical protein [Oscillospiraceae bacterium]